MSGDGSVYGLKRNRMDSIEFCGYRGFYGSLECFQNGTSLLYYLFFVGYMYIKNESLNYYFVN